MSEKLVNIKMDVKSVSNESGGSRKSSTNLKSFKTVKVDEAQKDKENMEKILLKRKKENALKLKSLVKINSLFSKRHSLASRLFTEDVTDEDLAAISYGGEDSSSAKMLSRQSQSKMGGVSESTYSVPGVIKKSMISSFTSHL